MLQLLVLFLVVGQSTHQVVFTFTIVQTRELSHLGNLLYQFLLFLLELSNNFCPFLHQRLVFFGELDAPGHRLMFLTGYFIDAGVFEHFKLVLELEQLYLSEQIPVHLLELLQLCSPGVGPLSLLLHLLHNCLLNVLDLVLQLLYLKLLCQQLLGAVVVLLLYPVELLELLANRQVEDGLQRAFKGVVGLLLLRVLPPIPVPLHVCIQ